MAAAARRFWMRSQREAVFRRYIVPDAHFLKAFAKAAIERLVVEHCYIAMAGTGAQMVATRSCLSYSQKMFTSSASVCWLAQTKLGSLSCTSPVQSLQWKCAPAPAILKSNNVVTMAMASESAKSGPSRLPIDLRGKRAFIAGVADDNGYGWAIAKALAAAGAEILVGTWVPALNIFETSLRRGKFDESRLLPDGSLMEITKVYPLDAVFDSSEDIKSNKRYAGSSNWTVKEVAESVKNDFGTIDILVHSLANGPEVVKPLLETSRKGYLGAISASSYSYVSLLQHFLPIMNPDMVEA